MESAEEVAEKIMLIALDIDSCEWNDHGKQNMKEIAAALKDYAEERVREAIGKIC